MNKFVMLPAGTALVSYRCTIKELHIGLDWAEPDRIVTLLPCEEANPFAIPSTFVPKLEGPPGTRAAPEQIVYTEWAVSPLKLFRR